MGMMERIGSRVGRHADCSGMDSSGWTGGTDAVSYIHLELSGSTCQAFALVLSSIRHFNLSTILSGIVIV